MKDPFQYDVFLSHNQADKPRVRRLSERLRVAGGRAQALWFDEWIIQQGDAICLAIGCELEAWRTLVCSAEAYWIRPKRSTVLFRDSANAGRLFQRLTRPNSRAVRISFRVSL